jgi:hypothetical protein
MNYAEGLQGIYIIPHFRENSLAYVSLFSFYTPSRGQSLGDIKRELGEINHDFFENKVAKYSANDDLSLLQANDMQGKVLILFSPV